MKKIIITIACLFVIGCEYDTTKYVPAAVNSPEIIEEIPEVVDVNDGFEAVEFVNHYMMYMIGEHGQITDYIPGSYYYKRYNYIVIRCNGEVDFRKSNLIVYDVATNKFLKYIPLKILCTEYITVFEVYYGNFIGNEVYAYGELWSKSGRLTVIPEMNYKIK